MVPSNLTSGNSVRKNLNSLHDMKSLGTHIFNRDKVMKFLNEYFFGFSEEELNAYQKSKEHLKDLNQL